MRIIESKVYLEQLDFPKIAEWLETVRHSEEEATLKERIDEMKVINKHYLVFVETK